MKRIIALTLTILLFILPWQTASADSAGRSPGITIHSEVVYLFNIDEQMLIYQQGADTPVYPASLVKIMTAILAIEQTPDLRTLVTFPIYVQNYLFDYQVRYGVSISLAGMTAGEQLPMSSLLHSIMLQSGNEAAMTIADHVGGGQQQFVEMMNQRAQELGATSTNFTNATGLPDPDMVTTARDMAIITLHAMSLPGFMEIATAISYETGPTNLSPNLTWNTTVAMQVPGSRFFYPHLRGIKTGTTPQAGRNFISSATRDGFTYLLVVMGAPLHDPETGELLAENYVFVDTMGIYEWVFDTFGLIPIVERNRRIHEIPLRLNSSQDFLPLETAERFAALVARDIDPEASLAHIFEVPESVDAPVARGDHMGYLRLMLYGRELGRVELVAAETVNATRFLVLLDQLSAVAGSFWFRSALIFIALLIVLYGLLAVVRNRNRRGKGGGYRPRRRI